MRILFMILVVVLGSFVPTVARADNDSPCTLAVGSGAGVTHTALGDSFGSDLRVRVKVLHLLGAELSYAPGQWRGAGFVPQYRPAVGLSGLFYVLPTSPVGVHLKVGVEGASLDRLERAGSNKVYHAGGSLDIGLGEHLVLGAEMLFLHYARPAQRPADARFDAALARMTADTYRASLSLMYHL